MADTRFVCRGAPAVLVPESIEQFEDQGVLSRFPPPPSSPLSSRLGKWRMAVWRVTSPTLTPLATPYYIEGMEPILQIQT